MLFLVELWGFSIRCWLYRCSLGGFGAGVSIFDGLTNGFNWCNTLSLLASVVGGLSGVMGGTVSGASFGVTWGGGGGSAALVLDSFCYHYLWCGC